MDYSQVDTTGLEPAAAPASTYDYSQVDTTGLEPARELPGAFISRPDRALPTPWKGSTNNALVGEDALYDFGTAGAVKQLWEGSAPLRDKLSNFIENVFPNTMHTKDKERAKAANAVAMAHVFDLPVSEAYDKHDQIAEALGLRQGPQNAPEFVLDMATNPMGMTAGVAAGAGALMATKSVGQTALHLGKGIASFMALQEGVRFGVSKLNDEEYLPMQSEGLSGLLPESTGRFTRDFTDLLEFIALGGVAAGIEKQGSKMLELFTRKTIVEHKLPETLYIPADRVRDVITASEFTEGKRTEIDGGILQEKAGVGTVKGITPTEYDFIVEVLGGDATLYKQAAQNGLEIEIPAEKIITIIDRPYWARLKELIRLRANAETTRVLAGDPRMKLKGLPSPDMVEPVAEPKLTPEPNAPRAAAAAPDLAATEAASDALIEEALNATGGRATGVSEGLISKKLRGWLTGMRTGEWPDIPTPKGMEKWFDALRSGDTSKIKLNWLLVDAQDIPFTVHAEGDQVAANATKELITDAFKLGEQSGKQTAKEAADARIDKLIDAYEAKLGKAKDRLETFKIRADLKKAQADLKAYAQKLVKRITKLPTKSADFAYKQIIEQVQSMYMPENWKKAIKPEAIRKFLQENPEVHDKLTKSQLRALEAYPAEQQTIADLEALHDLVNALNKEGQEVYRQKVLARNRKFKDTRDGIIDALGGPAAEPAGVTKALQKKKTVWVVGKQGVLGSFDANTLRPDRIFDMVDGGEAKFGGPAHKLFYDLTNELIANRMRVVENRKRAFTEAQSRFKITTKDLAKEHLVDGETFTLSEMMDIYAKWQNPRGKLAAIATLAEHYKGKDGDIYAMGERLGDNVIRKLDEKPQAKEFADWIIDEYDANFDRIRDVFIDYTNTDLAKETRYTSIHRFDPVKGDNPFEMADDLLHQANLQKAYPNRSMTKGRVDIPMEFQKPIKLGLVENWLKDLERQEHFIHLADHVRQMQRVLNDKTVGETITAKLGAPYLEQIQSYVNRVGSPTIFKAHDGFARYSQALRRNAYTAYLAYSLKTVLNQTAGLPLYMADAGPVHLLSAVRQFADPRNTKAMIEFVCEKDPFIKNRSILREFEELKALTEDTAGQTKERLNAIGMKLTTVCDRLITVVGWKAVYDRALADGLSEAEAIRLARNATLRTQSTAHAHLLPGIMAKNETLNWLSFMQNQTSQLWNMLRYDLPHAVKGENYKYAGLTALGLVMSAVMIDVIDEHSFNFGRAAAKQTLASIPLVGTYILSSASGYKRGPVPLEMASNIGKAGADILEGDIDKPKTLDELWQIACVTNGIPYTGPKRIVKAVVEGDPVEIIGKKRSNK